MQKKEFPKLYGLASRGTVKEWRIWIEEASQGAVIYTEHGAQGGKKQLATKKVKEGKNLGRVNETTPFEQAAAEAESTWKRKQDKNYVTDLKALAKGVGKEKKSVGPNLLPMLANKFHERKHKLVYPVWVQPKLDGVRVIATRVSKTEVVYTSRKNKPYKNLSFLTPFMVTIMDVGERLDGEAYCHGDISFQKLTSLVKEEKQPDWNGLKQYVRFWNYDVPDTGKSFTDRFVKRKDYKPGLAIKVQTYQAKDESEVMQYHTQFVTDGYEGTIVRSGGPDGYVYEFRSNQLLKLKDFDDAEFKILGAVEGEGKDEGTAIFTCDAGNGKTGPEREFSVRCRGSYEYRREQWRNWKKYVGRELSVRYQGKSEDGKPRFPVGLGVRDYE